MELGLLIISPLRGYSGLFRWVQCTIRIYNKKEEGRREGQRKQCDDGSRGQEDAILLPLKKEEGARSQGMLVPSISWKRQVNRFSPRDYRKEHSPTDTLISV